MRRALEAAVALLGILSADSRLARADGQATVSVKAATVVVDNDLDAAREAAIAEARRRCVKTVLRSDLLSPKQCRQHTDVLDKLFLTDPDAYIARFEIRNEEIIDDGQRYQVSVSAKIRRNAMNVALLENGIGDIFAMVAKPTVMVLVLERLETRTRGTRATETVLVKLLREKGFKVIDPQQRKLIELRNGLFAEKTGGVQAALQIAMAFKADYLVHGTAEVTSSNPLAGTDLKARFANMALRIVEASSARVLATEKAAGQSKHIDELTGSNWALEEAAKKAGEIVVAQFEKILRKEILEGAEVVVDMYGLDFASQAGEAESILKEIDSVSRVSLRFYYQGIAQFELKCGGTASSLADAMRDAEVDGELLEVLETLPRYLRVRRPGSKKKVGGNVQGLFAKYLDQKYKEFNLEKARARDKALEAKMETLAAHKKLNDEQKKQLYAAQKEIERRREEAFQKQKELERREKALREAEAAKREAQQQVRAMEQKAQQSQEEKARLEAQLTQASQQQYTATQNQANAGMSAVESASMWMDTINKGVDCFNKIQSSFAGM